jgi:hypothetical protein
VTDLLSRRTYLNDSDIPGTFRLEIEFQNPLDEPVGLKIIQVRSDDYEILYAPEAVLDANGATWRKPLDAGQVWKGWALCWWRPGLPPGGLVKMVPAESEVIGWNTELLFTGESWPAEFKMPVEIRANPVLAQLVISPERLQFPIAVQNLGFEVRTGQLHVSVESVSEDVPLAMVSIPFTSQPFSREEMPVVLALGSELLGVYAIRIEGEIGDMRWLASEETFQGGGESSTGEFRRADANADGTADMSDAITILSYLFLGGQMNNCLDAADVNDDGTVDLSDAVSLLGHLFLGTKAPPEPFIECGVDPPPKDELDCRTFRKCP